MASLASTSGSQVPKWPIVIPQHRRRAKALLHTSTNGKHIQSESTHSPPKAQTPDVHAHEGELAEGTGSAEENQVPDPLEQGPPTSPHVETPDLDERADSPHPERRSSPSLSQQDPVDR